MLNILTKVFNFSPAIVKREFCSYFHNSIAYVFLVIFLVMSSFFTFRFGDWFETEQADLVVYFGMHPYLYLFFIPALSMRMWSEEEREGTIELLLTYPITAWQAVASKFLAAWLFLGCALLLSFPMVLTVFALGDPDSGQLFSGYLASFLLGGVMLSLCALSSVLTPNQVVSYLVSFLVLLVLSGLGLQKVSHVFPDWISSDLLETLELFSIQSHYEALQRGVVDARDLLYNLSLILYGLIGTTAILRCRKAAHKNNRSITFIGLTVLSVILILVNVIASRLTYRADFTNDKLYSLSDSSKTILGKLKHQTVLRFYFSKTHTLTDVQQKAFALRVEDLLEEFSRHSNGKLSYEILNPVPGSQEEDRALLDGIAAYNGKEAAEPAYVGLAISYLDKNFTVDRLHRVDESEIEMSVVRVLKKAIANEKVNIGVVSTLPIYGSKANPGAGQYTDKPQWKIIKELSKDYNVLELPPQFPGLSDKLKLLILIHPPEFSEQTQYAIDQYVMNGGKVIAFLDPYAIMNIKRQAAGDNSVKINSDLVGLAGSWGVRLVKNELVADKENPQLVNDQEKLFMLDLRDNYYSKTDKTTKYLKRLLFAYSGHFDYKQIEGVTTTPLVWTSLNSQALDMTNGLNESDVAKEFKASNKKLNLALHLKGKLPSAFNGDALAKKHVKHIPCADNGEVILVSDADMLHDTFSFELKGSGETKERIKMSNNGDFFLNAVEQLCSDGDLIALRSRSKRSRRLEALKKKRVAIEQKWMPKKEKAYMKLRETKNSILQLHNKRLQQFALSLEEKDELINLESEQRDIERQIKKMGLAQQTEIKAYQDKIAWMNTAIIPLLIILFGLILSFLRKAKVSKR